MRAAIPDSEHSSEWVLRADTINKADYHKGNGNQPCPTGFPQETARLLFEPDSEHSSEWVLRADTINKADYRKGSLLYLWHPQRESNP